MYSNQLCRYLRGSVFCHHNKLLEVINIKKKIKDLFWLLVQGQVYPVFGALTGLSHGSSREWMGKQKLSPHN